MFGLVPFNRRNSVSSRKDFFGLDSFFDNFFNDSFAGFFTAVNPIRADIRETDKEYIIEADLPGVRKEDIRLELADGVLTLGVEHNEQIDEERDNYIRKERRYGSYCRSFRVDGVKEDNVTAKYENGVLTIKLPKTEEAKPKSHRIDIN
ncbi:MAG: Hsp20/alpha crystallin family protein [Clostridiaceae bacterium]|jgi:HSP20 family protein|nr:Hsp20/alpha crystallin family protein [Clostridiaceae bacterium]